MIRVGFHPPNGRADPPSISHYFISKTFDDARTWAMPELLKLVKEVDTVYVCTVSEFDMVGDLHPLREESFDWTGRKYTPFQGPWK